MNASARTVLLRIADVSADRLYENMSKSRSVKTEVAYLLRHDLIEPCVRDDAPGYRRTPAGDKALNP